MSNIRKGDNVVVITGSDKGKKGSVLKVFPKENRALVQGINVVKRHQRQTQTQQAGIVGDIEYGGHLNHDLYSLSRRLLADAFQHLPSLELGKRPAFLNTYDVTDLELALFVMGVILLGAAHGLAHHRMDEAALHLHHDGLLVLVADDSALEDSLRHGLNPWPGQRGAAR